MEMFVNNVLVSETVTSFFKTNLKQELAFDPRELISYAILG